MAAFLRRKAGIFMKQSTFFRVLFYIIGLLVLALGLTLNTKTGLGAHLLSQSLTARQSSPDIISAT